MESSWYFDGQTLSAPDPVSLPFSSAMLYGRGVFTTAAIQNTQPLLWDKHWSRLTTTADRLGIDLSKQSEESTAKALHDLTLANKVINGRARLTFLDLRSTHLWPIKTDRNTGLAIILGETREMPDRIHLTVSRYIVNSLSPLAGVKTSNYLDNIMAIEGARKYGSDEAIRLNERGEVTSGCMANVFWLDKGALFTPSLKTGCLPGTTREYVLENIECREVEAGIDELNTAEAIFLSSAGLGVVEVSDFDGKTFERSDHPILSLWPPT